MLFPAWRCKLQSAEIHDIFYRIDRMKTLMRPACSSLFSSSFNCIQPK